MPKKKKSKKITKKAQIKDTKSKQLPLGLKSPFVNIFYNIRSLLFDKYAKFDANKFVKDSLLWFFISIQGVLILTQLLLILNTYVRLPTLLPLVGYYDTLSHTILPKYLLFIFPVVSLLLFSTGLRISRKNYFKNKDLVVYICLITSTLILAFTFHIIRLFVAFNG